MILSKLSCVWLLLLRPPPRAPLFPYTTLFRSRAAVGRDHVNEAGVATGEKRPPRQRRTIPPHAQLQFHRHFRERRSEEHTSELQSRENLVCRLLLEKKKKKAPAIPVQTP